jgi:amyloid beta precursor protein binding protein 1
MMFPVNALGTYPKETSVHLALSALSAFWAKHPGDRPSVEALTAEAQELLGDISQEFPDEWDDAVGEM